MKTFLISIPDLLKKADDRLDAKAIMCDKVWNIFNDEGVSQIFIFLRDGSLKVSTNGVVTPATWEYISANKSIIINTNSESILFHPAFIDEYIFALKQDGIDRYFFMIDDSKKDECKIKALTDLNDYFEELAEKEKEKILQEKRAAELLEQEERMREIQLEQEKQEIEEKKQRDIELEKIYMEIYDKEKNNPDFKYNRIIRARIAVWITLGLYLISLVLLGILVNSRISGIIGMVSICAFIPIFTLCIIKVVSYEEYYRQHVRQKSHEILEEKYAPHNITQNNNKDVTSNQS